MIDGKLGQAPGGWRAGPLASVGAVAGAGKAAGDTGVDRRVGRGESVVDLRAAVEQMDAWSLHGDGKQADAGVVADDDFTMFEQRGYVRNGFVDDRYDVSGINAAQGLE